MVLAHFLECFWESSTILDEPGKNPLLFLPFSPIFRTKFNNFGFPNRFSSNFRLLQKLSAASKSL